MPLRSRAAFQKRLGAADPSRHPEAAELRQCCIEERPRAVGVTRFAASGEHERLVVVHDRAQWARTLRVEDGAGPGKPLDRLVVTLLQRAEPGHRQPRIAHRVPEVGTEDLLAQIRLQGFRMIAPARGSV